MGAPCPEEQLHAQARPERSTAGAAYGCCVAAASKPQNCKISTLPLPAAGAQPAAAPKPSRRVYWGGGGMPRLAASWRMRAFMPSTLCTAGKPGQDRSNEGLGTAVCVGVLAALEQTAMHCGRAHTTQGWEGEAVRQ